MIGSCEPSAFRLIGIRSGVKVEENKVIGFLLAIANLAYKPESWVKKNALNNKFKISQFNSEWKYLDENHKNPQTKTYCKLTFSNQLVRNLSIRLRSDYFCVVEFRWNISFLLHSGLELLFYLQKYWEWPKANWKTLQTLYDLKLIKMSKQWRRFTYTNIIP